jgi:putative Mg2+ transporter-C (MgtC) family protein
MFESWADLQSMLPGTAVKLLVAVACGFLLGMERERRDKPAGLRTIVLITVGSTLYMIVSELIPYMPYLGDWPSDITRTDPGRIAAQVVTGIGFLGAGTIIQARGAIHGLTTAAVIWVAAGIGLCIGIGFPVLAVGITLLVLFTLIATRPVRRWLSRRGKPQHLTLVVPDDSLALERVEQALAEHEVEEDEIHVRPYGAEKLCVEAVYHAGSRGSSSRLLEALARIEGVHGVPRAEMQSSA